MQFKQCTSSESNVSSVSSVHAVYGAVLPRSQMVFFYLIFSRWPVFWMWRTGQSGFWRSRCSTSNMDRSGEHNIWGKHAKPRNDLAKLGNREVDFQYSIFRPRFHEREVFPSHREVVMIQNNGKNRFVWSMISAMVEMIILLGWWYDHDDSEIRITMFSGYWYYDSSIPL